MQGLLRASEEVPEGSGGVGDSSMWRQHLTALPGVETGSRGMGTWLSPLVYLRARGGFDEGLWRDGIPATVMTVVLAGNALVSCHWGAGRNRTLSPSMPLLTFQPRGTPNHFICRGDLEFVQIYLHDALLDRIAGELLDGRTISGSLRPDLIFFADADLHRSVSTYVRRAMDAAEPPSRVEMDARAVIIAERLINRHHSGRPRERQRSGLAPWQLKRATEHLQDHLGEDVSLQALADLAGLSLYHFARAFRTSTGVPPQAYQRRLRCAKAKQLLAERGASVAAVAAEVGYAAPHAFTRMFRSEVGVTPSAYRREHIL